MSKICVLGLGYIGLPTASMLASAGHEVVGCDINAAIVASINSGKSHFDEPDLEMLLAAAIKTERLRAQSTPSEADYFIIAVPTPFMDGKRPDMQFVDASARSIAPLLRPGDTIILESTSPVGTTERIAAMLAGARPDLHFPRHTDETSPPGHVRLAHCPERILPGNMVRELVTNDRVIGGMTEACAEAAAKLYATFVRGDVFLTDCRTAEFVKLVENSYRDVNIAFANELSLIADRLDIDIWHAIELANKHPRVSILSPGPGVGGHCIAVDPWFVVDSAPDESRLIRTAREINDGKARYVFERIAKSMHRLRNPVVACYGLTYKPDVDDTRESPALEIVQHLAEKTDARLLVCEPNLEALPPGLAATGRVELCDIDAARIAADIVVFLVAHRQFRKINPNQFLSKIVIDTVGLMHSPQRFAAGMTPSRPARMADEAILKGTQT
jgi:UDP-N-acetyl-D-mannosaminuronic acid dehydrogenase